MASHLIHACIDISHANNTSIAILYIDLIKAFDRIVREIALGWPSQSSCDRRQLLLDLGIPAASVDEVYQSIEDCGPLLSQIGVDERTRILIDCLHTGSWFQFGGSSKFIIAKKGGRQGCRFGGKIFNLTYDKALREIRVELKRVGVCFTVYGSRGYPPFADCPPKSGKDIIDVTFVDDEAVIITAKHAADLLGKIPVVVLTIDRVFRKYGMSINFSKGKT